jgi:hypothetical protein
MVGKFLSSSMRLLQIFQLMAAAGADTIMTTTGVIIGMMGTGMITETMDTEMTASEMMLTGTIIGMMATGMTHIEMKDKDTTIEDKMITIGEVWPTMTAIEITFRGDPAHVPVATAVLPPASRSRNESNFPPTTGSTAKCSSETCPSQLLKTNSKRLLRNSAAF